MDLEERDYKDRWLNTRYEGGLTKDDFRKNKLMEDYRGREKIKINAEPGPLNPHIPLFITKTPWYSESVREKTIEPDLKDQKWYQRGKKVSSATKFRKGACENCGAISHNTKSCMERPRKKGAKYTGKDIQPDELVESFDYGFEAKRDRWNGYNPEEQLQSIKEWEIVQEKREKARKLKQLDKIASKAINSLDNDAESLSDDSDEEKYADGVDQVFNF